MRLECPPGFEVEEEKEAKKPWEIKARFMRQSDLAYVLRSQCKVYDHHYENDYWNSEYYFISYARKNEMKAEKEEMENVVPIWNETREVANILQVRRGGEEVARTCLRGRYRR